MKTLTTIVLFILMSSSLFSQDLKGKWTGTLQVQGTELRVIFHVTQTDGQYTTTLDSPDQKVTGIPIAATYFNNPGVKFESSNIGLVYEGLWADNRITGKWMQAGQSFPLILLKEEDVPKGNEHEKR